MSWVLLIWIHAAGMTIIEFPTREGCEAARTEITTESAHLRGICLEIK